MKESRKHKNEGMKPDIKEYILCDFIYMKFKIRLWFWKPDGGSLWEEKGGRDARHEDGELLKFCFFTWSAGYAGIFGLYTWDLCMFLCVCYPSVNSFPFVTIPYAKKKKKKVKLQKSK